MPTQEKVPAGSFTKLSSPVDDSPGLAEEEDTVDTSTLEGLSELGAAGVGGGEGLVLCLKGLFLQLLWYAPP